MTAALFLFGLDLLAPCHSGQAEALIRVDPSSIILTPHSVITIFSPWPTTHELSFLLYYFL